MAQGNSKRVTAAGVSLIALTGAVLGAAVMATADAQDNRTATISGAQAPVGAPSFADLIEHVSPAVVSVDVVTRIDLNDRIQGATPEDLPPGYREFFEFFQRGMPEQEPREARGAGSGFFISPDGLVVTNYHVINDADEITISTKEGREYTAEIVGSDELTDLALLRVEGDDFPYVQFDTDPQYRVGDWVVAVGNPFGLGGTATAGIISAIGREELGATYNAFLQIDAPINQGNSGGPTFDLNGNVIGVNSQIYSPTGGNIGIGFAIPSDVAANVIDQLATGGSVTRGWLGVGIQDVDDDLAESFAIDPDIEGAVVTSVTEGGPAAEGGFQVGDIIVAVNGNEIADVTDLQRQVGSLRAGERYRFDIVRFGEERTLRAEIGVRPSEDELQASRTPGAEPTPEPSDEGPMTVSGLQVAPLTDELRRSMGLASNIEGIAVVGVRSGSAAAERGFAEGMAISQVDGTAVTTPEEFTAALEAAREAGKPSAATLVQTSRGPLFVPLPLDEDDQDNG